MMETQLKVGVYEIEIEGNGKVWELVIDPGSTE